MHVDGKTGGREEQDYREREGGEWENVLTADLHSCIPSVQSSVYVYVPVRMLLTVLGWVVWLLSWSVWLLSWPALLLGWSLLLVMTLRVALGPEAATGLHHRLTAWLLSRFVVQQEFHLGPIKADLFRPMTELRLARPESADGALDILEVRRTPRLVSLSIVSVGICKRLFLLENT